MGSYGGGSGGYPGCLGGGVSRKQWCGETTEEEPHGMYVYTGLWMYGRRRTADTLRCQGYGWKSEARTYLTLALTYYLTSLSATYLQ